MFTNRFIIRKFFCKFTIFFSLLFPLIFVTSCGEFGNSSNFIGIGSNSISPLVMGKGSFMTNNPVGQYIYQNTGSGDGYKSQVNSNGFKSDFGMTSSRKNPKENVEMIKIWKNRKLRTITYAFDAIAIGINLPKGINLKSNVPMIELKELAKLYSKDKNLVSSVTWASLIINEKSNSLDESLSKAPIAIGIRGGVNTSGKSEAFLHVINKILPLHAKNSRQKQVISNQHFSFVDSFNDIYLENEKLEGSVAYYSLGQIDKVRSKKIMVANIDKFSKDMKKSPNINIVKEGKYNWLRPFNIIYSIDNDKSVALANYLLSPKAQKIILDRNFVPLNKNQIKIQLPTWTADLDYINKNGKLIYGINNKKQKELFLDYGLNI